MTGDKIGMKAGFFAGIGLLAALAACAPEYPAAEYRPGPVPVNFECKGGVRFSIAFDKKDDTASLVFSGHSIPEILQQKPQASGIEYGNEDYIFREHHGRARLIDLTQGVSEGVVAVCRRTRLK